jgi:4a-hydroxytetrahydrobiopterin dehydratase
MNGVPVSCGVYSLCQKDSAAGRTSGYAVGMQRMSTDDARRRMSEVPGWEMAGDAIRRLYTFSGFPEAMAFAVRLAFAAEAADHHPDIQISYKRVTLTYSTHSAGGLTEKDFAGAKEADRLAGAER